MAKFRMKQTIVDAVKVSDVLQGRVPEWLAHACEGGLAAIRQEKSEVKILTIRGNFTGNGTDWIVRNKDGTLRPHTAFSFQETYEPV